MSTLAAAVAAFKQAWEQADAEGKAGHRTEAGMAAAAPFIAAQALRDAADEWERIPRHYRPDYPDTWLRRRALSIRAEVKP